MSDHITINIVKPEEADLLLKLSRRTFFDAFASMNSPEDMQAYANANFTSQKISAELATTGSTFYFAVYHNQLIGYLKLNTGNAQTEFKRDNALEIERIYIQAKYQGKKFGEQLLKFAINIAEKQLFNYIWLGVWENNHHAIRFYERYGFAKFSSHHFMLGADKQTDVLMKRELT